MNVPMREEKAVLQVIELWSTLPADERLHRTYEQRLGRPLNSITGFEALPPELEFVGEADLALDEARKKGKGCVIREI